MSIKCRSTLGAGAAAAISICDTVSASCLTDALKQIKMYEVKNANQCAKFFFSIRFSIYFILSSVFFFTMFPENSSFELRGAKPQAHFINI